MDGKAWEPSIIEPPTTSFTVFANGRVQSVAVDHGAILLNLSPEYAFLAKLTWDGALGRVWSGDTALPFSRYEQIFEGELGAHSRDATGLKVPLYGAGFRLSETSILSGTYSGTGGVEGPVSLRGKHKPKAFGHCRYVTPVRVNQPFVVYQVHDGAAQDIPAVYEAAVSLGAPKTTVTTYAALTALTLGPGEWAKAPAIGMFRLGSEPSGKLTADVRGDNSGSYASTLSTIAVKMMASAGVLPSDIDTTGLNAVANVAWNAFVEGEETVGQVVTEAFAALGCYLFADERGVFRAGSWLNNGPTLKAGVGDGDLTILPGTLSQPETSPANYLVQVNGERCWTVHSSSEVSPAIAQLQEDAKALTGIAIATKEAAEQNADDIVVQKNRLDAIASDGILDRSEKAQAKLQFTMIAGSRAKIISDAAGYSVSTLAYTIAYDALNTYLNGLTPSWTNMAVDTPIDRTVWDARWSNEANARQTLLLAIAAATAKLANWDGVTGANKPADNATVGAPIGTMVGGVAAGTIADAAINFNTRNDRDATPILTPTFSGSGVKSTLNNDGSANVTVNWDWAGNASDIDGFIVTVRRGKPGSGR